VSCSTCGSHTDTPWDPTNDGASPAPCNGNVLNCNGQQSTCNNNQCQYSISYGDGSGYTANVYSTALTFGLNLVVCLLFSLFYFFPAFRKHAQRGN
jgi:hypothetical protein